MFKKTKIAAVSAAVLGLSSMTAQAVSIGEAGSQGQVLIFPYYNVNNGYTTIYNITNTTDRYKAVKIRFRESENSNDVLDFNLYMSPRDVFTMQLKRGSDDGVVLSTGDKSCTHPTIPDNGVLFRHGAYASTQLADVREGYLEVIEMGELNENATVPIFDDDGVTVIDRQFIASEGVLHGQDTGLPFDCSVITRAWTSGDFFQGGAYSNTASYDIVHPDAPSQFSVQNIDSDFRSYGQNFAKNITPPQGGLVGTSILIDTINITGFVAEPISVVNYSTQAQHYLSSDQHFYLLPSLASGSTSTSEHVSHPNSYGVVARDWGLDDLNVAPRKNVPSGINPMPLADALLVTDIANQYFLGSNTLTDWVIAAPMRKHAIYNNYQYVSDSTDFDEDTDIPVAGDEERGYWKLLKGTDITATEFKYWDREERVPQDPISPDDFSPPIERNGLAGTQVPFVREVNILALKASGDDSDDSVLGSVNSRTFTFEDSFTNGWAVLHFENDDYNLDGDRYQEWVMTDSDAMGVPFSGFMAVKSAIGSQNVGETFPHFHVTF